MINPTFEDRCIISCGMLHPEMTHLMESGFLDPHRIVFTPPGLHALPDELEGHLLKRLAQARESCPDHRIIVVYGKQCHVRTDEPLNRVGTSYDILPRSSAGGPGGRPGPLGWDSSAWPGS